LQVYTRQDLPQDWAMTQNNLGAALQAQGVRVGGEAGTRLLGEAVAAYRQALEVRTRAHLPAKWQLTVGNLAEAYGLLQQWPAAAALCRELYAFEPEDAEAYRRAAVIYHEILFDYSQAYALNQDWLRRHPEDVDAQAELAEKQFTTARYAEAARSLAALLAKPGLDANTQAALRGLDVLAAAAQGQPVDGKRLALRQWVAGQGEDFQLSWSFAGTRHFIETDPGLKPRREGLLRLLDALAGKGRSAIVQGLDALKPPG
jgi:hypothetical protein